MSQLEWIKKKYKIEYTVCPLCQKGSRQGGGEIDGKGHTHFTYSCKTKLEYYYERGHHYKWDSWCISSKMAIDVHLKAPIPI